MNIKKISYEEYGLLLDEVVKKIKITSLEKFDSIYGFPRGGLPIAVHLSHFLGIPLTLEKPELPSLGTYSRCLIVDDVSDTGNTLEEYKSNFFIATLFYKPQTKVIPDFYVEEVPNDVWIVFPYENEVK